MNNSIIHKKKIWIKIKEEMSVSEHPYLDYSQTFNEISIIYTIALQKLRNKFLDKHQKLSNLFSHEININNRGLELFRPLKYHHDERDSMLISDTKNKFIDWCIDNIEKE